jgi:predicted DCC family thiol-disulfide oxidoreductase YuxK
VTPGDVPAAARLVLYDGVCGFCNGSVRWILRRDREGRLHFAPLQGATADALRRRHPEMPASVAAIAFVAASAGEERVWLRSAAVFRILRELSPPWRWLAALRWLAPAALYDRVYDAFARRRFRWFGRLAECPVPPAAVRARFLP